MTKYSRAYVEITNDDVSVYDGIDGFGKPMGFPCIYRNKVQSLKAQPKKKKTDFGKAFAEICEEIPIEEIVEYLAEYSKKRSN